MSFTNGVHLGKTCWQWSQLKGKHASQKSTDFAEGTIYGKTTLEKLKEKWWIQEDPGNDQRKRYNGVSGSKPMTNLSTTSIRRGGSLLLKAYANKRDANLYKLKYKEMTSKTSCYNENNIIYTIIRVTLANVLSTI